MFRRIIKFGDSSHVISLPKKWIDKNNLKKGDLVVCNEETNELRILPHIADFKQNAKEITITLTENDKGRDVNRLSFLLWKALKKCSDNKVRQILDVTHDEVLFYWDIVLNLERIADNFKRLPRYVDGKLSDLKVEFVKDLIEIYKLIMKAFYKSDLDIAVKIKEEIKEMFINSEKVFSGHGNSIMSEKIKNILQGTSNIATQIILFPSEKRY